MSDVKKPPTDTDKSGVPQDMEPKEVKIRIPGESDPEKTQLIIQEGEGKSKDEDEGEATEEIESLSGRLHKPSVVRKALNFILYILVSIWKWSGRTLPRILDSVIGFFVSCWNALIGSDKEEDEKGVFIHSICTLSHLQECDGGHRVSITRAAYDALLERKIIPFQDLPKDERDEYTKHLIALQENKRKLRLYSGLAVGLIIGALVTIYISAIVRSENQVDEPPTDTSDAVSTEATDEDMSNPFKGVKSEELVALLQEKRERECTWESIKEVVPEKAAAFEKSTLATTPDHANAQYTSKVGKLQEIEKLASNITSEPDTNLYAVNPVAIKLSCPTINFSAKLNTSDNCEPVATRSSVSLPKAHYNGNWKFLLAIGVHYFNGIAVEKTEVEKAGRTWDPYITQVRKMMRLYDMIPESGWPTIAKNPSGTTRHSFNKTSLNSAFVNSLFNRLKDISEDEIQLVQLANWAIPMSATILSEDAKKELSSWLEEWWLASIDDFAQIESNVRGDDSWLKANRSKRQGWYMRRWIAKGRGEAGNDHITLFRYLMVKIAVMLEHQKIAEWVDYNLEEMRATRFLSGKTTYILELVILRDSIEPTSEENKSEEVVGGIPVKTTEPAKTVRKPSKPKHGKRGRGRGRGRSRGRGR